MHPSVQDIVEATGGTLAQGGGSEPQAAARLTGVSTDSRTLGAGEAFIAIIGEQFDGHRFAEAAARDGAGALVVSQPLDAARRRRRDSVGVPVIVVGDTTRAYGDIASWWAGQMPAKIVTLTGSNGKTTVKEMVAHLLDLLGPTLRSEGNHNNHIGVPETLLRLRPHHRFAVVEMGTNHPGELERLARLAVADAAIITNIGPSHLEAFGTERGVAREKMHLLDYLSANGLALLHADDPWSQWIALRHRERKATFGLSAEATWRASDVRLSDDGIVFEVAMCGTRFQVPVHGEHQVANCLAAVAVAAEMGLDTHAAAEQFRSFVPPKWRMAVSEVGGVTFVVDCYNANPASTSAALRELERREVAGRRVAVLGDMLELGAMAPQAHMDMGSLAVDSGIDLLCAVGEQSKATADAARRAGMPAEHVLWTDDRATAAAWARKRLGAGDAVLLKASRGVRLEEVAEALIRWAEADAGGGRRRTASAVEPAGAR